MAVGVLASGTGTILDALLESGVRVAVVVTDRPCKALDIARNAGVASELVQRPSFGPEFDRLAYTHTVVDVLLAHGVDVVAMAGYGTVLEKPFFEAFPGRVLNTHPALLPAFPGWHAVEEALAAGVKVTGCTVHVATVDVDRGPILAQEAVAVRDDDTVDTLHERIKAVERRLYPATLKEFLAR
ncbi:MAG: phosphoribosylglycinamide formyltransferase [Acidimicrobiales bacterium]